jgi:hypothetical protein
VCQEYRFCLNPVKKVNNKVCVLRVSILLLTHILYCLLSWLGSDTIDTLDTHTLLFTFLTGFRQNQSTKPENCENRNDPDLIQAFLKKWWVESDFKAPNLPLSLRLRNRLLDQGYKKIRLIRSLKKFIFRYQDLVEIYSVSAETIISDAFSYRENV